MKLLFFILLTIVAISRYILADLSPTISLLNGKIQGSVLTTRKNRTYYAFHGIPYAKPPINNLRFEPPQPASNWNGVLLATSEKAICYQFALPGMQSANDVIMSENCLYISIYTPRLPTNRRRVKLPVMLWIYGGGFNSGHYLDEIYGPQYFMDYGVILAKVNYRLGVFGFLSTGDAAAPGNNGLKDQLFALKWLKRNIGNFGGDRNRITIFGESSGGAGVSYLLLNNEARNRVHGAIMQSGTSLTMSAFQENPRQYAYELAKFVSGNNASGNSTKQIVDLLKSLPTQTVYNAYLNVSNEVFLENRLTEFKNLVFLPVIEQNHHGAFLTKKNYEYIAAGNASRVPQIIGYTSEETIVLGKDLSFGEALKEWNKNPTLLIPKNLKVNESLQTEIGYKIKDIYCKDDNFTNCQAGGIKFAGDMALIRAIIKHAKLQSQYSDVFFYKFSYKGRLGQDNFTIDGAEKVGHFEDIFYMFHVNGIDLKDYPDNDIKTLDRLLTMWTNFAKYLNPTPQPSELLQNVCWVKMDPNRQNYLDIGENLAMKEIPRPTFGQWENLYDTYGKRPFITY